ncbi:MAG: hypothetical protein AB7V13_13380 [Pseudorhodoplanes sp.]
MSRINSLHFSVGIGALLAVFVAGCSNGDNPASALADANGTNIQRLSNLYFTFQSEHEWRGPRDETEFKSFLHSIDPAKLERIGIDASNIDALFISERDGQPFAIRYGVQGNVMGSSEPVVFEATGDGGKRLVGFLNMTQREVDPAEYDALKSGQVAAAPPQRESRP